MTGPDGTPEYSSHTEALLGNRVFLAPLAGVADPSFRLVCRLFGAGPLYTEMVSSHGLSQGRNYLLSSQMALLELQRPLAVQLVGRDPEYMAGAAVMAQEMGADSINLNMACPAPKIVRSGKGSALMKEPELAAQIVSTVAARVTLPVTVKIRAGWDKGQENAVEFAQAVQEAGASMVILHPRTRAQGYSGRSDWRLIARTREKLTIPLIGNGDIQSPLDAEKMMRETGCDGVMIGRGSYGRPWLFHEVLSHLTALGLIPGGTVGTSSALAELIRRAGGPIAPELCHRGDRPEVGRVVRLHAVLATEADGAETTAREIRKHLCWYSRGMAGATELRRSLSKITNFEALEKYGFSFFQSGSAF